MKIKKVEIKNIASIKDATIDFENSALKDAPLFLICGETGTGKTTILDAITLALYRKTPRYIGLNGDTSVGGIAYSSIKQLVRRGAKSASAKVTLLGDDGIIYEACWSVNEKTQGKNKGTLNDPSWQWKNCKTDEIYSLVGSCESVCEKATGLKFEQFCRVSMLAQGQFTKFLLGNDDEKAAILEKLTNTESFTKIGIAIGAKYKELKDDDEKLKNQLDNHQGLDIEQRASLEKELDEHTISLSTKKVEFESNKKRMEWKENEENNSRENAEIKQALTLKCANLKASKEAAEAKIAECEEDIQDLEKYLRDREMMVPMFEQSAAILTNLKNVRDAKSNICEAQKKREELLVKRDETGVAVNNIKLELDNAQNAIIAKEKELNEVQSNLDVINLPKLRKEKEALQDRQHKIEGLQKDQDNIKTSRADLQSCRTKIENEKEELSNKKAELPNLEKAKNDAKAKCEEADRERYTICKYVESGIDAIIAELQEGDVCPICKSRILHLNGNNYYFKLNKELQCKYDNANSVCKKAESEYNQAKAYIDAENKRITNEVNSSNAKEKEITKKECEIKENAVKLAIYDISNLAIEIDKCKVEIATTETKIKEGEAKEAEYRKLTKAKEESVKAKDSVQNRLKKAENDCTDCVAKIKEFEAQISTYEKTAKSALDVASTQIISEGWKERWLANPEEWEQWLRNETDVYNRKKQDLQSKNVEIDRKKNDAKTLEDCLLHLLSLLPSLNTDGINGSIEPNIEQRINELLGQLQSIEKKNRELKNSKPEDLSVDDTIDSLKEICNNLNSQISKINESIGRLRQQLEDDDKRANERKRIEQNYKTAHQKLIDWESIYSKLGDNDGKKFRRIIQSYILGNVLHKANFYLQKLCERYTLSSSELVLSVIDSYEGNNERPVNTLSGGEQFLVSLSLALGLAGMNETGLAVEMLFIDEGFGTLSGEYLNSAIETLESLNKLTGSRKVGVISHVERLRERIHTHIEVTKSGSEPSKITII